MLPIIAGQTFCQVEYLHNASLSLSLKLELESSNQNAAGRNLGFFFQLNKRQSEPVNKIFPLLKFMVVIYKHVCYESVCN